MMLAQDPFTQSQEEKGPQKNRGVLGAQCSVAHVKIRYCFLLAGMLPDIIQS